MKLNSKKDLKHQVEQKILLLEIKLKKRENFLKNIFQSKPISMITFSWARLSRKATSSRKKRPY